MTPQEYIELIQNKRLLLLSGKGGVGKSALSWAIGLALSKRGVKVRVVEMGSTHAHWPPLLGSQIAYSSLETMSVFKEYVLTLIRAEKLYNALFDRPLVRTFVETAPGVSDSVLAGKLLNLVETHPDECVIVDLPSSGHALSFLRAPFALTKLFGASFIHRDAERVCSLLTDESTQLDLIATPEELPVTELGELLASLKAVAPFRFGAIHCNKLLPNFGLVPEEIDDELWKTHQHQLHEQTAAFALLERYGLDIVSHKETPQSETSAIIHVISEGFDA